MIGRRGFLGGAAAFLAGCSRRPPPAPPAPGTPWSEILAKAREEGRVLMYGGVIGAARVRAVAAAFHAATGIDFDFLPVTGAAAMTRIHEEAKVGIAPDIFEGTGGWLSQLAETGMLLPLRRQALPVWRQPETVWNVHPGYKAQDWSQVLSRLRVRQGHLGINTELLARIGVPGSWQEVATDRRFRSTMVLLDPSRSTSASAEFVIQGYVGRKLTARQLWAIFALQDPMLVAVPRANVMAVTQGERAMTFPPIDETVMNLVEAGAPVRNIYFPDTPIFAETAEMGVLRAGAHPHAAIVFVDWFLSRAGQTLLADLLEQTSIRSDVPNMVPPALRGRVVGNGRRGPIVVDRPVQTDLTQELRSSGVMKHLVDGSPASKFEAELSAFVADWERRKGGPQASPLVVSMR